jgi:hypothetical protein
MTAQLCGASPLPSEDSIAMMEGTVSVRSRDGTRAPHRRAGGASRPIREPHVSNSPPEFDSNEAVLAAIEFDNAHELAQQKIDRADQPTECRLGKVRLWRHRGEDSDKQPKTNTRISTRSAKCVPMSCMTRWSGSASSPPKRPRRSRVGAISRTETRNGSDRQPLRCWMKPRCGRPFPTRRTSLAECRLADHEALFRTAISTTFGLGA